MEDALSDIRAALDRVEKHRVANATTSIAAIDEMLVMIKGAKEKLRRGKAESQVQGGAEDVEMSRSLPIHSGGSHEIMIGLQQHLESVKPKKDRVAQEQKSYHAAIAKLSKTVDKHLTGDLDSVMRSVPFDTYQLNAAIAEHLCRRGSFEAAEIFSREIGMDMDPEQVRPLVEINGAVDALRVHNAAPAFAWVKQHAQNLKELGSTLELQLVSLEYVRILTVRHNSRREALDFARSNFHRLAEEGHMGEVAHMMGALAYSKCLVESPYAHLLSPDLWDRAAQTLVTDGCRIAGLSAESLLSIAARAGVAAAPTLLRMASIVRCSQRRWDDMQELLVEVPLPPHLLYHSIFSCPVSREQAGKDNPPVLLRCGHVICKKSMMNIAKTGPAGRFKCPTCPAHQSESEVRELVL